MAGPIYQSTTAFRDVREWWYDPWRWSWILTPWTLPRSELDPLIEPDEKGPTKKEARMARAQFLALCWALCVIGWTDGSGPLPPRIQIVYDVSNGCFPLIIFIKPLFKISADRVWNCVLGVCVAMLGQWTSLLGRHHLTPFSGSSYKSIAQYAIERQTGFRKRELLDFSKIFFFQDSS